LLIIDDDPKVSWILREGLQSEYDIITASDGIEGIQIASKEKPPLILLDIKMPGMSGLEVLRKLKKADLPSDVIMLSGQGETETVVEAVQLGAFYFINKPFDVREVDLQLQKALERRGLIAQIGVMEQQIVAQSAWDGFIGDSASMIEVKGLIEQVADSELSVLIRGESGTGKEIVARMLHQLSSRRAHQFVKVNCAAIPKELLEAELFGYEKGAFTGAHKNKPGRFETANKGTIFLDEIGDMSFELQAKLLQVLEQQEFVRVGGINTIKVDVRIICATNRDLEQAIYERLFRDDLFYRLNEITVTLPSLRNRREDIPLLVHHFLRKYGDFYKRPHASVSTACMSAMVEYVWPGNVRQLENLIKQLVVRQDEAVVFESIRTSPEAPMTERSMRQARSPQAVGPTGPSPASGVVPGDDKNFSLKDRLTRTIENEEKKLIAEVLRKTNWNRRKASQILEISYRSLLYKIKEYRLNEVE
jgi:two-component system, NtrC family, response regulator AtoC